MPAICRTIGLVALAAALVPTLAQAQAIPTKRVLENAAGDARGKIIPRERTIATLRLDPTRISLVAPDAKALPKIQPGDLGSSAPAPDGQATDKAADGSSPRNYGSGNLATVFHYSDRRAELPASAPQRATGKFIFVAADNLSYSCSAALISKSIIALAGHCVHEGNNSSAGWIKSGTFYPAYAAGANSTYKQATAAQMFTTTGWYSTGALDQGFDVALVVLNKTKKPKAEIGVATGWYGFCYQNCLLSNFSLTQLGYPGNYDGGEMMNQGNHHYVSDNFDYIFGSGMQGGSSGGPHVANIGVVSDTSTNLGQYATRNVLYAVTSWGYNNTSVKIQGASTTSGPGNANGFVAMFNNACTAARALHGTATCSLLP